MFEKMDANFWGPIGAQKASETYSTAAFKVDEWAGN